MLQDKLQAETCLFISIRPQEWVFVWMLRADRLKLWAQVHRGGRARPRRL